MGDLAASGQDAATLEFFEKRIRPVLVERCHECHSAKAAKLKAGLYLDSRAGALRGGESGPAIVPGQPGQSRLIRAVSYEDVDLQMPPRKRLADAEIADLKTWIAAGAVWPDDDGATVVAAGGFDVAALKARHWAWQPIRNVAAPQVRQAGWPRDSLDHFVLAKLEQSGLRPGPDADRRTLLRRLTFDLTGLPPMPAEMHAFLADESPDAVRNVVRRLLDSPRFGERWARHWLDMVRYSETLGHEFDYEIPNAWRYRDYVIRAFNADVRYDQFIREHVAGDLLKQPRRHPTEGFNESVIGTAFYWFGQQKHSPVDIRQETADTIDNQIDVLTKTFLGMTVSCARCHDHKFDAISTRDYYALFGVLGSSRYAQVAIDEEMAVRPIRGRLVQLNDRIQQAAFEAVSGELSRAGEYLRAARAMRNRPRAVEGAGNAIVFEDFEGELKGWETTGDAFTGPQSQATIGSYQGDVNARGKGFINSHNAGREGTTERSDRFTGTLTSPAFRIERRYIHFLVGGGAHADQTCINLVLDGRVVRTTTGKNNNRMEPARFDVREFAGREARLIAVDRIKGGWGNIGWDHIVFSDRADELEGGGASPPNGRAVAQVAAEHSLDAATLGRWVTALDGLKDLKELRVEAAPRGCEVLEDFVGEDLSSWHAEGLAWNRSAHSTDAVPQPDGKGGLWFPGAGWWMNSAAYAARLQGALRSRTFEITSDYVHVLVAGEGARINAVVDNFTIIRNPIWGGLRQEVNRAEPHWVTFDLRMVRGHRVWLEFLDVTTGDPGGKAGFPADAWIAVRQVLRSDEARPPQGFTRHPLAKDAGALDGADIGRLADAVARTIRDWRRARAESSLWNVPEQTALLNWLADAGLLFDSGVRGQALAGLLEERRNLAATIPDVRRVPGMVDGNGVDEFVFIRGNPRNRGTVAPRAFMEALRDEPRYDTRLSGRRELAEDLVDPANPLPARVIVNKVWHHLFGRGIVATVDNFGVLGERPSHPELLDHLARGFQDDGWSVKRLIERMVLSRTYQLAGKPTDSRAEGVDPNNLLLHRANVKRLEGEAIRDAMLAVSGALRDELFGEPVPVHLTAFMEGRGRPKGSGPVDGAGRRSIYTAVRRNFLPPMMLAFDTPLPATTVGRRAVSNVPAQALILMNDELVVQLARRWAESLGVQSDAVKLVNTMYESAFGRLPTPDERNAAVGFLEEQEALHGGEDGRQRALADLAHVLFNVKEFVFVN